MEPSSTVSAPVPTGGSDGSLLASPSWSSSTNWAPCRGSLQDSICFETSASVLEEGGGVDVGSASVSRGLILARPADQESAPCEITISLRQRHEIHRIYVQSTARVYEVYFASDCQPGDNEYLCTVRCGASEKEVFLPGCDNGKCVVSLDDSSPSEEVHVKMTNCESNGSNEEEGWVEVKIPDSPLPGYESNTSLRKSDCNVVGYSQVCYEATAEISDASPCTSLILRLLSLSSKDCIYIEEIYIYADPVDCTDSKYPSSMTGNMAGNSFLAMLVPSMMQLTKTESNRVCNRTLSSGPVQKFEFDAVTEEMDSKVARPKFQETPKTMVEKEQVLAQITSDEKIVKTGFDVPSQHNVQESFPDVVVSNGHIEKVLDELVSRVGRIEASLLRFEDNILKPLSCIDTRLQRVEQQLDVLSSRSASSKPFQCSRFSAPEFQVDDCDSDEGSDVADMVREDATVNSPNVVREEATVDSPSVGQEDTFVDDQNLVDGPVLSDGVMTVPASDVCQRLFDEVSDFPIVEDEHVGSNYFSDGNLNSPKAKASLSIDEALSSALKAFMLSSSINSQKNDIPSVIESQSSDVAADHLILDENAGCELSKISGFNVNDGVCSTNVDQRTDTTVEEGEGQQMFNQSRYWHSFRGLVMDDASEMYENDSGSEKGSGNNINLDEVPNPLQACRIWNEDSSSDSNFDENVNESHENMNLLDEKSTDSDNEPYTLRCWLSGRLDDHRFNGACSQGIMNCNEMNTPACDKSVGCNQIASMMLIQNALISCQNGANKEDSEESLRCNQNTSRFDALRGLNSSQEPEILDPPLNKESSFLDVQFVQHEKSNYAFQLDGLVMDMLNCEAEGSEMRHEIGKHRLTPFLEIAEADAPLTRNDPFIDLEATIGSSDIRTEVGSNEQLFSSLI